jgi:hypothetical protein
MPEAEIAGSITRALLFLHAILSTTGPTLTISVHACGHVVLSNAPGGTSDESSQIIAQHRHHLNPFSPHLPSKLTPITSQFDQPETNECHHLNVQKVTYSLAYATHHLVCASHYYTRDVYRNYLKILWFLSWVDAANPTGTVSG